VGGRGDHPMRVLVQGIGVNCCNKCNLQLVYLAGWEEGAKFAKEEEGVLKRRV
jgi:hypothetical protein